jgi:hypothetical protein
MIARLIYGLSIASLALAAGGVAVLAAAFSVSGLARLFSGASMAVSLMAIALEFSKFVITAFLHQTWKQLNFVFRTYLLIAVVVLSIITSTGIFGFLSDAYQASSMDLQSHQVKVEALRAVQQRNQEEIVRINKVVDEVPMTYISKKIKARKEAEPLIRDLTLKTEKIAEELKQLDLNTLNIKAKVGPLIYVAHTFKQDVDTVVKWLILIFVSVFDPLAICLVIATSEAMKLRPRVTSPTSNEVNDTPIFVTSTPPSTDAQAQEPIKIDQKGKTTQSADTIQMKFVDDTDSDES